VRVFITGANGFVGRFLCQFLVETGHKVVAAVRTLPKKPFQKMVEVAVIGNIGPETDWADLLRGQAVVIHLAGRAHANDKRNLNIDALYYSVNVEGTICLAKASLTAGVKRFIYLSSIKAMCEGSGNRALIESMVPEPEDIYGKTKREAELGLLEVVNNAVMGALILRPPLIYGPGVKGNFLSLMLACNRGFPFPLKNIKNKRSFLYLGNLVEALSLLVEVKNIANGIFLISDSDSISTPELIRRISFSLGRPSRLYPFPIWLLHLFGLICGKPGAITRLVGTLEIDASELKKTLGWTPSFNMIQGLEETAKWFLDKRI